MSGLTREAAGAGESAPISRESPPTRSEPRPAGVRVVGVLLFPDVEDLDFVGPLEVFGIAGRLAPGTFDALTVAQAPQVRTRYGMTVIPAHSLDSAPHLDVLVIPGGYGTRHETENPPLLSWIAERAAQAEVAASVCTGAFLLAASGVLIDGDATTHWESIERLRDTYPGLTVRAHARWVDRGHIATSAGIAAGIDLALHLVSRLSSPALAARAARQMEYPWEPDAANAGGTHG